MLSGLPDARMVDVGLNERQVTGNECADKILTNGYIVKLFVSAQYLSIKYN